MKKIIKHKKGENQFVVISLLFFFFLATLFFIINVITGLFSNETSYDENYIAQYAEESDNTGTEKKIIKDYSKFYTIQSILEQFTDSLINGEYQKAYTILEPELKKKYKNKNECMDKLKGFTSDNLILKDANNAFVNKNKLKEVYILSGNDYLAKYITISGNTKIIGVRLDVRKSKYSIFYIEM